MSKGSKIIPVRMEASLIESISRQLNSRNEKSANSPWTMSDFIRASVIEKLQHYRRSQRFYSAKKREVAR